MCFEKKREELNGEKGFAPWKERSLSVEEKRRDSARKKGSTLLTGGKRKSPTGEGQGTFLSVGKKGGEPPVSKTGKRGLTSVPGKKEETAARRGVF